MKLFEAIKKADLLRENMIPEEIKAEWIYSLECEFAEVMGEPFSGNSFPMEKELLMPFPYDEAYYLYLAAMIDNANQDVELYENDKTLANAAVARAKAWYRREHRPDFRGNWRVL